MPVTKAKRDERAAKGLCVLCDNPRATRADGKPSTHCQTHLEYFKTYQRGWRAENAPPRRNRCTVCRKPGHSADRCPERPS